MALTGVQFAIAWAYAVLVDTIWIQAIAANAQYVQACRPDFDEDADVK